MIAAESNCKMVRRPGAPIVSRLSEAPITAHYGALERLIEHVRLRFHEVVVNRLKMHPRDEIVADMFVAVAGARFRHDLRLHTGRLDEQLHLAAPLQSDEPKGSGVNTVP